MKKTLSHALALLLVLSLFPLALLGCEDDQAEPDQSNPVISEEESLADVSEESSEPEEDTTPMVNISQDPSYTNVALNKTYKKSNLHPADNPSYPDEGNISMTDGILPAERANYSDKAFMGFSRSSADYCANGYSAITVDLGGNYALDKFVAHTASCQFLRVGIDAPSIVWIFVSNDGEEWHRVGATTQVDDAKKANVECTLVIEEAVTARYVQYRFCANAGGWMFISEVEAYGIATERQLAYPVQNVDKKILFVGNSTTFFFNIPYKVFYIAQSAGINIEVEYCCGGGAYLSQYADPSNQLGALFKSKLNATKYDYVVLQDNGNADYAESQPALEKLVPMIRATGAEVVLYKRYSSNDDPAQRPASAYRHEVNYTKLAETYDIEKVAPVADAFLICTEKYPKINLYHTDDSHHSDIGGYLSACVLAMTYLDIDVEDITYTAGLDEETANALKECAKIACEQGYDYNK